MSTTTDNLSTQNIPSALGMRVGIVVCEWNSQITQPLLEGAVGTLKKYGVKPEHIVVKTFQEVLNLYMEQTRWLKADSLTE